jgi:L-ribulose-5-phosphate 4-epimerase
MNHGELREIVWIENQRLWESGLVTLTWGNVSGLLPDRSAMIIKPSGVPYQELHPEHLVMVDLDGNVLDGNLRPSSDTATHLEIYRGFPTVGGIAHSHSPCAVAFAQTRREIPCYGTTHADHFHGPVPVTQPLTESEVESAYELETGRVIVERFTDLDPIAIPGVLVAGHGPFTWGAGATQATDNAIALEAIAEMALGTVSVNPDTPVLEQYLLDKHHGRKHGSEATYGQEAAAPRSNDEVVERLRDGSRAARDGRGDFVE